MQSWLIAKRTLIVLNHTRVLTSIVAVYQAIRLKVCLSFNISCALRATNVPKFIIDCEVYSVKG